jgi:DNA polymerase III subunit epsilon
MTNVLFTAFDVEVSSRSPSTICAVGAVLFNDDQEVSSFSSLVAVKGRVHYTHIHGLTSEMLNGAPSWPDVWLGLRPLLTSAPTVVAFRASFDRAALLTMSGLHGIRLPQLNFTCVAEQAERILARRCPLSEHLQRLGIPFPGQPHVPLADARAAALLFLAVRSYSVVKES